MRKLWSQCSDERGIAIVVALFVMAILLVSGVFLARMSSTENDIAYSSVWAEASFFAADAAVNVALDAITPTTTNPGPLTGSFGSGWATYNYSGAVAFSGTQQLPGYSLGAGTGYNPGGYVFYNFSVTGTGTGPRSASRTINVQAQYGPVAQ
jgi:hypothetical protein